ncbi:IS5 family transposase [Streptomyces niveus]|uniref:IS5 family transposase n=1 Tax=Streptomyces niveus TaxID=193462 RepID=UPI0035DA6B3B
MAARRRYQAARSRPDHGPRRRALGRVRNVGWSSAVRGGSHEVTDQVWAVIGPLPAPPRMGRPVRDRRQVLNGILWKLSTGAAWRDLPERYGPWKTVYERFRRWSADGTWDRLPAHVQQHSDATGEVDWSIVCVDSTIVRAHQHAAGARKGALGR